MFSGRHFDRSVILLSVRWYLAHLAHNLSLRDLEEMMAERGIHVDHSTIHRGSCASHRYCPNSSTIDGLGDTVDFFFSENRDLLAAKRFILKALRQILSGIEMVHMMRKRQAEYTYNQAPSLAEQFQILAA